MATPPKNGPRGKYLTLAVLLAWVAAIFAYTIFKYSAR